MTKVASITFSSDRLVEFTKRVFQFFGVPDEDAQTAATVLSTSDPHLKRQIEIVVIDSHRSTIRVRGRR